MHDHLILKVEDNGVGIDFEKHGDNLFKLYKRFHTHVDGKGMGLFMVKTQVEALGGTIGVSGELDVGLIFTLQHPDNA
ncbi:MAG: ATP-binding protein [Cyclobacteriaceae bacterium]|nr:ATP-binding protein [Cyclobacteriaceae bacterium]